MNARTVRKVDKLLAKAYGEKLWRRRANALDELILTVLSQHTSDVNRDKAFARLKERFPKWDDVLRASVRAITHAIRPAGLAEQKAPRIRDILKQIQDERGELSLEFLGELPIDEALAYLSRFNGVGPKTAACVLMFSFGKPVFPVDTHIHRITKRLGWIDERTNADKAHEVLNAIVPDALKYQLHLNLIAHGRKTCNAQNPKCPSCIIRRYCAFYRQVAVAERRSAEGRQVPRGGR